jgi:hypothetical protein
VCGIKSNASSKPAAGFRPPLRSVQHSRQQIGDLRASLPGSHRGVAVQHMAERNSPFLRRVRRREDNSPRILGRPPRIETAQPVEQKYPPSRSAGQALLPAHKILAAFRISAAFQFFHDRSNGRLRLPRVESHRHFGHDCIAIFLVRRGHFFEGACEQPVAFPRCLLRRGLCAIRQVSGEGLGPSFGGFRQGCCRRTHSLIGSGQIQPRKKGQGDGNPEKDDCQPVSRFKF